MNLSDNLNRKIGAKLPVTNDEDFSPSSF